MENLESGELEKQVIAVDTAAEIVNLLALKTVETFSKAANKFPLAERLYRFGSIIVPHLELLINKTEDSETKILAAVVLLRFGSEVGIDVLLNAISRDEQYPCLAASCLAAAGIKIAIYPISDRLRNATFEEIDLIVGLLTALEELKGEIPGDIYGRFTVADAPWQIRFVLENTDKSIKVDSVVGGVVSTGEVGRDLVVNNLAAEEKKTLAEAAAEIQQLLDRLSSTYPTTTVEEKANVAAKIMEEIEKKPDTRTKIVKTLKAGGKATLIELTDNPVVNILVPMLESLLEDGK